MEELMQKSKTASLKFINDQAAAAAAAVARRGCAATE
jgi:hypothetical protein